MHTVIIGIGGVGGYFGGKIIDSGQKVTLVARGKHLEVILKDGLQVKSIAGDFIAHPFMVTDSIDKVEKADLILICTKSWQVKEAGALIKPILKEDTVVIPLQNGADNAEKLVSVVDKEHVLGGLCRIYSKIESPGVISHFGHTPEVVFGELDRKKTDRLHKVKEIFDKAGFKNTISEDIGVAIWTKFMFIATVSGLGALTRASIGEMYEAPDVKKLLEQTATEIYKVGIAKGVALPTTIVDSIMNFIGKQPFDSTASTQRDILEGRPSELENFNGYIVNEGKRLGVSTPVNTFVYSCLAPMEIKARK
ncbi:2-dehydropantoate 2-reductase [Aquimarina sp. AD10]|uniref:ketopantoate reductase family protein n=1 Tax=Aquimarina sp. AD10 TaxID=1714849 RepID=UPI000E48BFC3|nr:2-dehydropantoate 2-reductase [Aquimarina sp. AD10]AXT62234.1 2-dehydropantoate 2-reductase [Aquimarina sp. AD10]RKM90571.1 2-dehydropantoate 2-reductase [Aquimarina sp. AD10]